MNLKSPVSRITGIGPKYERALEKLDINTLYDLITYYPFRYDDFSEVKNIADLSANEEVTIEAELQEITNIFSRNGKRLTKATVTDSTGKIEITWFNQHYILKRFKEGNKYRFSGKTQLFNKKIGLIAPRVEDSEKEALNTGRLVPVYSESGGITSAWLRSKISDLLNNTELRTQLKEYLPDDSLKRQKLINLDAALKLIHFPDDETDIKNAKNRLAFEELLIELLRVESRKNLWKETYEGVNLTTKGHEDKIKEFLANLPFKLTHSQEKTSKEIIKDLAGTNPMNRLLEGDVGSGKTIVAVIASYICHLNGYKTLYMAPTEILAKQHYETFTKFLGETEVEIKLQTGSQKTEINKRTDDIIIGTHALLFTKEEITKVGLVIIDEQHRFGVEQRAKLIKLGEQNKKPNLLSMTATPIPRTLALTVYGDLDISLIDTVPHKDKKILTKVIPENMREKSYKWIKSTGLQTFIVCPFITPSTHESFENVKAAEQEYENLKKGVFSDIPVGLLHGKMKQKEKDQVISDFRSGKYQILVSTPVIEVGVDIPDATVIVIESGERYGLASLHQLRGRVGRAGQMGYCFVFMSGYSKKSYARLKNLENISSGMKLAEIDMNYRGQGDMFGTMQHGFKQFKLASLDNVELIEQAQKEAKVIYPKLEEYNTLYQIVQNENEKLVINN